MPDVGLRGPVASTVVPFSQQLDLGGNVSYTGSHALVIGVGRYEKLPKDRHLRFAADDARELADVLIQNYGFSPANVTVLLDEQASRGNIEAALSRLADSNTVKVGDRVLIYFSGHGHTVKLSGGGEIGFLIPYGAEVDLTDIGNPANYLRECIRMESLWHYLEASPARHRLLLADACFGGLLIRPRALGGERPNASFLASLLARPAMQAMTAGTSDEQAFESPSLGHGLFTYKLLEELRAEAAAEGNVFLASQLAAILKISVGNLAADLHCKMTPQFGNHGGTEGDFVFVTTAPGPIPPPLDHMEWISIPADDFLMGDNDQSDNPRHRVYLDAYRISKYPVTVKQYFEFVRAMGHREPSEPSWGWKEDHPVVNVSWDDAMAYCGWLSQKTGRKVTLPSEAQWERASRGTDGRKYPWGNDWDATRLHCSKQNYGDAKSTAPVGSYPSGASPYGVLDMSGNVWEWCLDWYDHNFPKRSSKNNPINNTNGNARVMRGGSWGINYPVFFRSSIRYYVNPSYIQVLQLRVPGRLRTLIALCSLSLLPFGCGRSPHPKKNLLQKLPFQLLGLT